MRVKPEWLVLGVLFGLAIVIRLVGLRQETGDTVIFEVWYRDMQVAGGWRALGTHISNYNAPFLYLLALSLYLPGAVVIKIKAIWMLFDVLLAFFTYKLVGAAWPGRPRVAVLSALVMLFVPTVVLNASFYGQIDSMWASFAIGGLYFLIRGRYWWGVGLCTVSLAVKPQGIFIFPLVALLVLAGRIPWRSLLAVPAVYLALDLPAIALGRNPIELLTIYNPERQARYVPNLTSGAPTIYAFVRATPDRMDSIKAIGYLFCAALVLGVIYVLLARAVALTAPRIVTAATLFAILVPFTMPGTHERYFYLADVLSVILAFYRPRLWFVPLLEVSASLLTYLPYLFHGAAHSAVPLVVPATLMLAALLIVTYTLMREAVRPTAAQKDEDREFTTYAQRIPMVSP